MNTVTVLGLILSVIGVVNVNRAQDPPSVYVGMLVLAIGIVVATIGVVVKRIGL